MAQQGTDQPAPTQPDESLKIWNNGAKHWIVLNDRFAFIQIPKTSSTSVQTACKAYKDARLGKNLPAYRHEGLEYLEQFMKDPSPPVYAIVRNPYLHAISYFFHRLRLDETKADANLTLHENFERFLEDHVNNPHLQQARYLRSRKGIKPRLFKMEEDGTRALIEHINREHGLALKIEHANGHSVAGYDKTSKEALLAFYAGARARDLVREARREEFATFGYSDNVDDIKVAH